MSLLALGGRSSHGMFGNIRGRGNIMKLEELFLGKPFISDLGEAQTITEKEQEIVVGQYAVWVPVRGTKRHQIVEVGDDLGSLMSKYNISEESVCVLV